MVKAISTTAITRGRHQPHRHGFFTKPDGTFSANPVKPKDVRKIYGFGVGGPIIKDKLFWYFAFDRFDRNFPVPLSPAVRQASRTPVADITNYGGTCAL